MTLSSILGAALKFSLTQTKVTLVLPEAIKKEVEIHFKDDFKDHKNKIKSSYRFIEQVMGERDDFKLPADKEISQKFNDIIKKQCSK